MSTGDGDNAGIDDAVSVKELADTLLAGTDIEEVARRETRKAIRARVSSMVKTALKTGIDDELKGQLNDVISAVVTESVQAATTPPDDTEPEVDTPDPTAERDAFLAWVESTLPRIETPKWRKPSAAGARNGGTAPKPWTASTPSISSTSPPRPTVPCPHGGWTTGTGTADPCSHKMASSSNAPPTDKPQKPTDQKPPHRSAAGRLVPLPRNRRIDSRSRRGSQRLRLRPSGPRSDSLEGYARRLIGCFPRGIRR